MKFKYKDLGLTEEEAQVVERYKRALQKRRMATTLAPFFLEIKKQYPELSEELVQELAEAEYKKQQAEFGLKSRRAPETE